MTRTRPTDSAARAVKAAWTRRSPLKGRPSTISTWTRRAFAGSRWLRPSIPGARLSPSSRQRGDAAAAPPAPQGDRRGQARPGCGTKATQRDDPKVRRKGSFRNLCSQQGGGREAPPFSSFAEGRRRRTGTTPRYPFTAAMRREFGHGRRRGASKISEMSLSRR